MNVEMGKLAIDVFIVLVAVLALAGIAVDLILATPAYRDSVRRNGMPRHERIKGWWK